MAQRIVLFESIHPVARDALRDAGHDVELLDRALPEDELIAKLQGVHVAGIRSKSQITAKVIASCPDLVAVGAFCIGTNQVDLDAAAAHGVPVFNAPFSNTRSVAELVLAEVVMLSRGIGDRVQEMHRGEWRKTAKDAHEVRGKTLGIIGYGHIGRQVGVLAEAFGMRVMFHDIASVLPMGNNVPDELEHLLGESDFVTLHVPETAQTKDMIGARELGMMKPGACLLNLSRGTVVDIPALAAALKSGHLRGASVDVFPVEPKKNISDDFESELVGIPNVILTPHIGGSTLEAQENIGREVSAALLKHISTGATAGAVRFPQVDLPRADDVFRVCHVHRNEPGVLRDVNKLAAQADANIVAQVLATDGDIGYLVMDLAPAHPELADALAALPTTIRVRVIR